MRTSRAKLHIIHVQNPIYIDFTLGCQYNLVMSNEPYWKTRNAADNALKTFYAGTESDVVSVADIYKATGRDLRAKAKNSAWLSNKLATLRRYEYVDTTYSSVGRRKVASIKLTDAGRNALGRTTSTNTQKPMQATLINDDSEHDNKVTPETVLRDVNILKKQLPSFNVVFKIEPKELVER